MANLQIKGIQDELYDEIKKMASTENRSISQQVLFLIKEYMNKKKYFNTLKTPAQVLMDLAGSWNDAREAEDIIKEIKDARKNSSKLHEGL